MAVEVREEGTVKDAHSISVFLAQAYMLLMHGRITAELKEYFQ